MNDKADARSDLAIAIAVCVAIVLALSACAMRRRPPDKAHARLDEPAKPQCDAVNVWDVLERQRLRLELTEIELQHRISKSNVSEVWCGLYRGLPVAVKRLASSSRLLELAEDIANSCQTLASVRHPHIIALVGVAWTNDRFVDVQALLEFAPHGDLRSILLSTDSLAPSLSWTNKLSLALNIAEAVTYLYDTGGHVRCGGLTWWNILLDERLAKLQLLQATRGTTLAVCDLAPIGWIAPEALTGDFDNSDSESVAVYALGVLLTVLASEKEPYSDETHGMRELQIARAVAERVLTLQIPSSCPCGIATLARACVAHDPAQRPRAAVVARDLRDVCDGHVL